MVPRLKRKLAWYDWVTPRLLREQPIHRWYVFPHSFAPNLVHELIDQWKLDGDDCVLDPFAGAGTTLLASKEKGVRSSGYDLSPLAVLVTRVKTTAYKTTRLNAAWTQLARKLQSFNANRLQRTYADLVVDALPGKLLSGFEFIGRSIDSLNCSEAERDFFRLALLTLVPMYSRAVATGGWLSWIDTKTRVTSLITNFRNAVETMLEEYRENSPPARPHCDISLADARRLPDRTRRYSAVITSPPYPNRHDYTRVFGVELMFAFLNWEQTRNLRYQTFSSHPESHPERPRANGYAIPDSLNRVLNRMRNDFEDERIPEMLEGYFLDMYLCLRQLKRVCRSKAKLAFVVGNARYHGQTILVDKLTGEIGEQVGLTCKELIVARYRGNSAQQMGRFGKRPSRESVVIFENV